MASQASCVKLALSSPSSLLQPNSFYHPLMGSHISSPHIAMWSDKPLIVNDRHDWVIVNIFVPEHGCHVSMEMLKIQLEEGSLEGGGCVVAGCVSCAQRPNWGSLYPGRSSVSNGCQGWITHSGAGLTLVITSDCRVPLSSFVGPQWLHNL